MAEFDIHTDPYEFQDRETLGKYMHWMRKQWDEFEHFLDTEDTMRENIFKIITLERIVEVAGAWDNEAEDAMKSLIRAEELMAEEAARAAAPSREELMEELVATDKMIQSLSAKGFYPTDRMEKLHLRRLELLDLL